MKRKSIRPMSPTEIVKAGRKVLNENQSDFKRRVSINMDKIVTPKFKQLPIKIDYKRRKSKIIKEIPEIVRPRAFSPLPERKPINVQEELK